MRMKFRNIFRMIFLLIFCLMVVVIVFKYSGYERRALLFELTREVAILYIFLIELTLALLKNYKHFKSAWKKVILYMVSVFAIFSIVLFIVNIYKLSMDAFVFGYNTKEVTILNRNWQYKSSDKVRVEFEGGIYTYSLLPGYTEVDTSKSYLVNIFKLSKIMIAIEEK